MLNTIALQTTPVQLLRTAVWFGLRTETACAMFLCGYEQGCQLDVLDTGGMQLAAGEFNDSLKTKNDLNYTYRSSPYRAVNTLRLCYTNQSANAI